MSVISISIPDATLSAISPSPEQAANELRLLAAMKLFEMGRLSSGAAAQLAGIPRTVFLMKLGEYGIPTFQMTEEELREDVEHASGRF